MKVIIRLMYFIDYFHKIENFIINFDPKEEKYDELRAYAYIIQKLCIPYIWTTEFNIYPKKLIKKTIEILENMISIDDEEWFFLDSWGESIEEETELKREIKVQIEELEVRLTDWIGK